MQVWKENQQWHFIARFLDENKTGVFDAALDEKVITTLEASSPNSSVTEKNILNAMNRPWLKLTG